MGACWLLALAPVVALAGNVTVHVTLLRWAPRLAKMRSFLAAFACAIVLAIALSVLANALLAQGPARQACQIAANLITTAALGYGYFQFVNLGQTARRVRLLREFVERDGPLSMEEILSRYNAQEIIRVRLLRLLGSGQVELRDGRYYVANSTILAMAHIMDGLKHLLVPPSGHEREPGGRA